MIVCTTTPVGVGVSELVPRAINSNSEGLSHAIHHGQLLLTWRPELGRAREGWAKEGWAREGWAGEGWAGEGLGWHR